jgi:hypothetical protein
VLLTLGVSACRIGSDPAKSPAATSPFGVQIAIRLRPPSEDSPIQAELLAIRDDGYLVVDNTTIMLVLFGSAEEARVSDVPGMKTLEGDPPPADRLDKARMHARYPFGLTEEQLAVLLENRNQEALVIR